MPASCCVPGRWSFLTSNYQSAGGDDDGGSTAAKSCGREELFEREKTTKFLTPFLQEPFHPPALIPSAGLRKLLLDAQSLGETDGSRPRRSSWLESVPSQVDG